MTNEEAVELLEVVDNVIDSCPSQFEDEENTLNDFGNAMKLYQGDCLEVMKNIADKSVDCIITDPPYIIETVGAGIYKQAQYVKELTNIKDGFNPLVFDEVVRVMKKINIYFFCSQKQIIPLLDYFVTQKKCNWNLLTWHKTNPVPACGNKYLTDTEYILFFREKGVKIYGNCKSKLTYYVTPTNKTDKKIYKHPTIKPIEIINNLIINSSNEQDVILDPFMGSGTTGVACVNTNRNFIGIELDETYFNIAKQRIEQAHETKELF